MEEQLIYSPEPLENIMDKEIGNNGDLFTSTSINRNNKATDIYITCSNTARVIPRIYRGYKLDGNIKYHSKTYPYLTPSTTRTITFEYDYLNDYEYVTYYVVFESVDFNCELIVDDIGVIFDRFDQTSSNVKKYSTTLITDINNNPLYEQDYSFTNSFSIIMNRTDLEQLVNIIEKPYYLVDVKNSCIDNSSGLIVATSITPTFITSATKMIAVNINNIVSI